MSKPQVIVLNIDIYALGYVDNLSNIEEFKTFQADKLISNQYDIQVKNFDNFFSVDNSKSAFNSINWLYTDVYVYDENSQLIWHGLLTNIERNHETGRAILKTKSTITKIFNQIVNYTSSTWETGAEAFENICASLNFSDYNQQIVNRSIDILQANDCYLKCDFDIDDGVTFHNAIEKLAEFSACDCYSHLNKIYFRFWEEFTGVTDISLTKKDLLELPVIIPDSKNIVNDYYIGYSGDNGVPATDENSDNIGMKSRAIFGLQRLPEMSSNNDDDQILMKDKVSASFIGNRYIIRTNKDYLTKPKPRQLVSFSLKEEFEDFVSLQSYFDLTFENESWTNKPFETYKIDNQDDNNRILIEAYET